MNSRLLAPAGFTIGFFMITPLLVMLIFAFSSSSLLKLPIESLTFHWFTALYETQGFYPSLVNSLVISLTVGFASTVIGTLAAFGMTAGRHRMLRLSMPLLVLPLLVPPLVLGIVFLSYFSGLGFRLGPLTTIIAQTVTLQPIVILILASRLSGFDWAAVDSARDLGATSLRTFIDITFPMIRPTILGAALIVMALSLDDFIITFFTIGGENTLPTLLWGMMRKGIDPRMNACAFILVLLTLLLGGLALRLTRNRS
jgi:spermidine/putrescine transport system permease protein